MIDIASDRLINLNDAAKLLGRRVSTSTWWRWRTKGVRGHRLTMTNVGARLMVSVEALQAFIAAINGEPGPSTAPRTNRQRQSAIARAEAECVKAGI